MELTHLGKGSKVQALVDEDSMSLMFQLTSANPNESTITHSLPDDVDEFPDIVVADKAYDYDFLRDAFAARGSKLLSPHRVTRSKPLRDQEQIGRHYEPTLRRRTVLLLARGGGSPPDRETCRALLVMALPRHQSIYFDAGIGHDL